MMGGGFHSKGRKEAGAVQLSTKQAAEAKILGGAWSEGAQPTCFLSEGRESFGVGSQLILTDFIRNCFFIVIHRDTR
jgi:hypothetical protein